MKFLLIETGNSLEGPSRTLKDTDFPPDFSVNRLTSELTPRILTVLKPDVILIECSASQGACLEVVRRVRAICANVPIVLLAWESTEEFVIDALNCGVTRYLKLPCSHSTFHELQLTLEQQYRSQVNAPENGLRGGSCLAGVSAPICELRKYIQQVAASESNVLITGETGTGKELVAQLIQQNSRRHDKPYICLNSAAIPEALIESELFGYEKGAFTGALSSQDGKLAAANHGTVFFDEIGDVSPTVQAKLLRAIESKRIYRLGSNRSHDLDIRILAASNQDLEAATLQNRFRSDLYYRLNVIRVDVPPLRDRLEDLPALLEHYVKYFGRQFQKAITGCSDTTLDLMFSYSWPGNIRELKNVLEAAFVTFDDHFDGLLHLPDSLVKTLSASSKLNHGERAMLVRALTATNWNRTQAAKKLHWSRMTLYRKMVRYQVNSSVKSRNRFGDN